MGTFSLSGGVEVVGFISPTDPLDNYPVIDPLYGIDGFRNVNDLTELNTIPNPRRRSGMVVGVSGGTIYYKLNNPPWNGTISDWSTFNSGGGTFTGGTVSGNTIFTSGLTASTLNVDIIGDPTDCVDELYLSNLYGCNTGVTLHNDIEPISDNTINLGTPIRRFRDINTISGTTTYWTSTNVVNTPNLNLGLDSESNQRTITANNSIIQNDILMGGTY